MVKDAEEARKKLLAYAPAVPSPLRRRVSSRTILASRLAATTLDSHSDASDGGSVAMPDENPDPLAHAQQANDGLGGDEMYNAAMLASYRARVRSVLAQPAAVPV